MILIWQAYTIHTYIQTHIHTHTHTHTHQVEELKRQLHSLEEERSRGNGAKVQGLGFRLGFRV
jgi:hypothetical protein